MTTAWMAIFLVVLTWSGIHPRDYFTWIMEVAPAVIAFIILLATHKRFPLTRLAYTLILIHSIILMVGGHYTYVRCRSSTGCGMPCIRRETITTRWDTLRRGSFRPSLREK